MGYQSSLMAGMASCAGPSMVNAHVYAAPGLLPSNTTIFGIKVLSSVYGNPTSNTMLYAQAHYNTGSEFFYTQGKTGIAIAQNYSSDPRRPTQAAGFMTRSAWRAHYRIQYYGPKFRRVIGFVRDSSYGRGFYIGLNLQTNF